MKIYDLIIVKAQISMKSSENGGRISGFKSGYRPNHIFEMQNNGQFLNSYIGDILFDDQEVIKPGETKIVKVRFLKNSEIEKYIKVGQKWFINEGARNFGIGEILEIIS